MLILCVNRVYFCGDMVLYLTRMIGVCSQWKCVGNRFDRVCVDIDMDRDMDVPSDRRRNRIHIPRALRRKGWLGVEGCGGVASDGSRRR